MKRKMSLNRLWIFASVFFVLLLQYKYFFLPADFTSIFVKYNTDDCSLMIVVVLLFALLGYSLINRKTRVTKSYFSKDVLILLLFTFMELGYSIIRYNGLNTSRTISNYSYLLVPLFYFVLLILFNKYQGYSFFIKTFTLFNIAICIMLILAAVQYNITGRMFLHVYSVEHGTFYARNQMIRIYAASGVIMTSVVVSIASLFSKENMKLLHIINTVCGIMEIYYVQQTRMVLVVVSVILIIAFFSFETRHKYFRLIVAVALAAFGIQVLLSEISFSTKEISYVTRLHSYQYFSLYGITHPLFGMGLLTETDSAYLSILHSITKTAYVSDVGIVGVFGNFGVFPVIWYIIMIIKYLRIPTPKAMKFRISFVMFLLISAFTIVPFGYSNMIFFPITMAIIEYKSYLGAFKEISYAQAIGK